MTNKDEKVIETLRRAVCENDFIDIAYNAAYL